MAITPQMTNRLKEHVRDAIDALSERGWNERWGSDPTFYVWDAVRSALGKSYSECEDSDIPRAISALQSLLERIKDETGRQG